MSAVNRQVTWSYFCCTIQQGVSTLVTCQVSKHSIKRTAKITLPYPNNNSFVYLSATNNKTKPFILFHS